MKTIGFPISTKENEKRRAIIPDDVSRINHPSKVIIEKGFGKDLGFSDMDYENKGCIICKHDEVLDCDIICDPKIGDANYLDKLHNGQTIFGWIHATQNRDITDRIINSGLTAYAWEKMFEHGRHVFWLNNELAGEAAIINAFQCYGQLPYGLKVAVIGNGNTARGATRALNMLGANVMQYNRYQEELLKMELSSFDVIVNCILWDVNRKDHIIYKEDIKKLKKNALIIDVSCDKHGGIETSEPTSIENPVYYVDGIMHYAVDHTPSIFYKTFSYNNSHILIPYINDLIESNANSVLDSSLIIKEGVIIDNEITTYQNR